MGLETGTYLSDLDANNPISSDKKKQGDDHLRLIKELLKATFPNATKPFYFPTAEGKSANFTIAESDDNKTFYIDTSGGNVTATLPTLDAGDAGWKCTFLKIAGAFPSWVKAASGNVISGSLSGISFARRSIIGVPWTAFWNGTAWYISRCIGIPIGTVLPWNGTSLPTGYEWPNGQTLVSASANYNEYNATVGSGITPDVKGRAMFGGPMGGAASGRLTGTDLNDGTQGDTGGVGTQLIERTHLPDYVLPDTLGIGGTLFFNGQAYVIDSLPAMNQGGDGANLNNIARANNATALTIINGLSITGDITLGGSGGAFPLIPPAIVMNHILVVE